MQLDISKDEVYQVIKNALYEEERKKVSVKQISNASSLGMFYLDAVINIDLTIKHAQQSMWKAYLSAILLSNTFPINDNRE
jgi:adenylate cyclase